MSSKPFTADYAKDYSTECKGCKLRIEQDKLRLGITVQDKVPTFYHWQCFWPQEELTKEEGIEGFQGLDWGDQRRISDMISGCDANFKESEYELPLEEFSVEYAVTSRAKCHGCFNKIDKDALRISVTNFQYSYIGLFHRMSPSKGRRPDWYHAICFIAERNHLRFFESGDKLPGFDDLEDEDKELLKEKLKKRNITIRKRKTDGSSDDAAAAKVPKKNDEKDVLKVQNE